MLAFLTNKTMKQVERYGANLYGIDFTADEVEQVLVRAGYVIEDFVGAVKTRHITGYDGGGGVELSDWYETQAITWIAYLPGDKPTDLLEGRDHKHDPQLVFKEVMKQKFLKL